jgi:hypothetical protein
VVDRLLNNLALWEEDSGEEIPEFSEAGFPMMRFNDWN